MRQARSGTRRWGHRLTGWLVLSLLVTAARAADEPLPLHERIDRAIESANAGQLAAPATDAEFLRRVSLDLAGIIPTADEARAFLDDPSPYKRTRLIERLLDSPDHARRMAAAFDVMLMERRPEKHVPAKDWREFLRQSFAQNKPYDVLVREILAADGSEPAPERRAPARFVLDREGEPALLVRDVGRLFLGRDLQCAQCHDHPLIDDYKQAHYQGLLAFYNRTTLVQDASGKSGLAEKADGDVSYSSVFKKGITHKTGPRVLDGPELAETAPAKGDEYWVYPGDKVRSIPRYSRRAQLAGKLAATDVPDFARNGANRIWAIVMGRGLIHPLDLGHGDNPPSNPEALDLITAEFVASGYDIKKLVRELVLTRTYARSSEPAPGMSAEQAAPERFAVAALKPMSPEQLGWSVMQATGVVANYKTMIRNQVVTADPKLAAIVASGPARADLASTLQHNRLHELLTPSLGSFVGLFGVVGQTEDGTQASVDQALMLANGEPLRSWLGPSGENLTARLATLTDPNALADELYLATLTRRPTPEERQEVAQYLESRSAERPQAIQELAWALLTSAEFRFNH